MGRRRNRKQGAKETYDASPAPQQIAQERKLREEAVGAVGDRAGKLEEFLSRPGVQGRALPGHGDGAHTEAYSKAGHGHQKSDIGDFAHGHGYAAISGTHDNSHHTVNYAGVNHTHSQSIKLMSAERRAAAVDLRGRLRERAAAEPDPLIDGILVLMALLFDDAEEALEETLDRGADEQLVRHLWESGRMDPGDVEAPPERPHPDLDRITRS